MQSSTSVRKAIISGKRTTTFDMHGEYCTVDDTVSCGPPVSVVMVVKGHVTICGPNITQDVNAMIKCLQIKRGNNFKLSSLLLVTSHLIKLTCIDSVRADRGEGGFSLVPFICDATIFTALPSKNKPGLRDYTSNSVFY